MKIFTDGTLLTAEDINNYLLNNPEPLQSLKTEIDGNISQLKSKLDTVSNLASTPTDDSHETPNRGYPIKIVKGFTTDRTGIYANMLNKHFSDYLRFPTNRLYILDTGLKSIELCAIGFHNRGNINWGYIATNKYPRNSIGKIDLTSKYGNPPGASNTIKVHGVRDNNEETIKLVLFFEVKKPGELDSLVMSDGTRDYIAILAGETA